MIAPGHPGQQHLRCLFALLGLLSLILPFNGAAARQSPDARVAMLLEAMSLEQRVGQMFMVSVYGEGLPQPTEAFLREMMPGGIAMFASNGTVPERATATVNAWQMFATQIGARVPLIIAIDHEGGPVTRLGEGFTSLPWGAALSAMPAEEAQKVGMIAARELRAVGINMNLAPVVDVRTVSVQPLFMEHRSLGPDPLAVGRAASAYVQGLQANGVISTLKHFPGHGSAGDSHHFLPIVHQTREELERIELAPFKAAIASGADVVMVGHLSVPALEPELRLPASLSRAIISEVLRKELGFTGVAMTDAMDMGAIVENFTAPVAAVMAVQAGIDLIATGPHLPLNVQLAMKQAVLDAVARGDIAEARIEEAVQRILRLKAKYGLLDWAPLDVATAAQRVHTEAHRELLEGIYLNTIAVAFDNISSVPLQPEQKRIAVVFPGAFPAVQRECAALSKPSKTLAYSLNPSDDELVAVRQIARDTDIVVVFTYNIHEYPRQVWLVNSLPPEKTIVAALQSPYDFERGIEPGAYVLAFNAYPPAFRALCAVLYGRHRAVGSFPVIFG